MKKTYQAKKHQANHKWYLIDATDKILGRLATQVAMRLRGKHKPEYTPHADVGDYIIIINAEKIKVTGNKEEDKLYFHHSGYPGGIKERNLAEMRQKAPERILELAIKRMMPRNPLGRSMYKKLKVYSGASHHHHAQNPELIDL